MKTKILSIVAIITGLGLFAGAATYMLNTHTEYQCTLRDDESEDLIGPVTVKDYRSYFVAEFPNFTVTSGTMKSVDVLGQNLKDMSYSTKNKSTFFRGISLQSDTPRFGVTFADNHAYSMGACSKI